MCIRDRGKYSGVARVYTLGVPGYLLWGVPGYILRELPEYILWEYPGTYPSMTQTTRFRTQVRQSIYLSTLLDAPLSFFFSFCFPVAFLTRVLVPLRLPASFCGNHPLRLDAFLAARALLTSLIPSVLSPKWGWSGKLWYTHPHFGFSWLSAFRRGGDKQLVIRVE